VEIIGLGRTFYSDAGAGFVTRTDFMLRCGAVRFSLMYFLSVKLKHGAQEVINSTFQIYNFTLRGAWLILCAELTDGQIREKIPETGNEYLSRGAALYG